jgi:type II secretory pathway component PulF
MTLWRYTAVPIEGAERRMRRTGELAGNCPADVRSALRRIGLQVIDLRPVRASGRRWAARAPEPNWLYDIRTSIRLSGYRYLRRRRQNQRAELYDGVATMLATGLPLLEAVDTLIGSTDGRRRLGRPAALRSTLMAVREQLRSGSSLAQAMTEHPSWFEPSEVAMVRAGQHGGLLPDVLQALTQRHEHSGQLTQKLTTALAYPSIVATVGLAVIAFLSVKTLPDLVTILSDASIEIPALTSRVMAFGQLVAGHWLLIGTALVVLTATGFVAAGVLASRGIELPQRLRRLSPKLLRKVAVARVSLQLAELLRAGVPMVEAMRVLAPTAAGSALRRHLLSAADQIERGEELAVALGDGHWFDTEFCRLLEVGQASGELEELLERLGHRYTRQANRLIGRLAALLEPCVILILAVLVGVVVMAAVLPLVRLQEVL